MLHKASLNLEMGIKNKKFKKVLLFNQKKKIKNKVLILVHYYKIKIITESTVNNLSLKKSQLDS